MYNNASNKGRNAPGTMQRDAGMQKADRAAKGPNNVYADRSGNVQRQTNQGWQTRDNQGQWKSSGSGSSMNRDAQARQRGSSGGGSSYGGASYGGSRGSSGGGRSSGGGSRGGGGGGRRR
jgi:hypothetical protein